MDREFPPELLEGYCTLCRSRCGSLNLIQDGRLVKVTPSPSHPTGGALCAKGRAAPELLASPLRLTHPLRRTGARGQGEWKQISWSEALDEIAGRLLHQRAIYGAESVAFAVTTPSGTPMVDSFEWVERFVRCYGSPNLIYAVEVCGWHKDYAHALTFGRGIGVPDLENTDVIVLWGHNPARTWLKQASRIGTARQRGAKVVVIDPKQEGSGQQADIWLRIRPGADGVLALGAIRHLISTRRYDDAFVRRWTNAPALVDQESGKLLRANEIWPAQDAGAYVVALSQGEFGATTNIASLANEVLLDAAGTLVDRHGRSRSYTTVFRLLASAVEPYDVASVAEHTWIDAKEIAQFNALFQDSPRLCYHAWTGVGQHSNATQTERAIATLYALCGACDRQGGNLWTVAPPYRAVNTYHELLSEEQRSKALGISQLPLGPPRLGWITARDFSAAVLEHKPYPVQMLMSFGSNLLVSQSDTERNIRALRALEFHVHVDMYMNPTAQNADIVLPANTPWEREALKCGFEITQDAVEHVQLRQRMVTPLGESRADYEIVFELAKRLGLNDAFFGGDIEAGWNFQLAPLGITVADLRAHPGGMRFPQAFSHEKYARRDAAGRPAGFPTESGFVELYSEALLDIGQPPIPAFAEPAHDSESTGLREAFPILLSTAKNGWFVHSSHRHVASLRKKSLLPQVSMSGALGEHLGIQSEDWVRITTPSGHVVMRAHLDEHLHRDVAIADFGWWQGCTALGQDDAPIVGNGSFNINSILSDADRDPVSGSVPLRAVQCRISPEIAMNRGRWAGPRAFRIASKRSLGEDIAEFEFTPIDERPLPDFLPGQHVMVSLAGVDIRRAYSLTGQNCAPQVFTIGVRRRVTDQTNACSMSAHLHGLDAGDQVFLFPPSGSYTIPTVSRRPIILVAGGIGITPFVGYLQAVSKGAAAAPDITLVYVCRNSHTHAYAARLKELAQDISTVKIITVYRAPLSSDRIGVDFDNSDDLDFGWIEDETLKRRPLAYLCGAPKFLQDATEALSRRGIPLFDIFTEAFSADVKIPSTLRPQSIQVEGNDAKFEWRPELGSLLDAGERFHVALPSGCRVGQCESCSMQIVSGQVVHLSPYEGPPDRCLTCQAVPLSTVILRR